MSNNRLFHIIAALVVVFICTNNVVQGKRKGGGGGGKKNSDESTILTVATFLVSSTPPGRLVSLGETIESCLSTNDKTKIRAAALKSLNQLEKSVQPNNGKKVKPRNFNDDEEEEFEERFSLPKNPLTSAKSFFGVLNGNELKTYAADLKKLNGGQKEQYVKDVINFAAQCAAQQIAGKRSELVDDYQDNVDDEGY
jgi:hypothetical protein